MFPLHTAAIVNASRRAHLFYLWNVSGQEEGLLGLGGYRVPEYEVNPKNLLLS